MRLLVIATLLWLISGTCVSASDLFNELKALPNPLARLVYLQKQTSAADTPKYGSSMQFLAFQSAELADYNLAESSYQLNASRISSDVLPPAELQPEAAASAIVRQSTGHRLLVVNEAHHIARNRWLTLQLLPGLRAQGFTHLALEALDAKDADLQTRGYPITDSGFYTREPVFGELIREALRLGFKLIAYEYTGDEPDQQTRETGQAKQLAAVLKANPDARILVHAGYAHIYRNAGAELFGARSMIDELETMTGLRALSVDQTGLFDHPDPSNDHPALVNALARWQEVHQSPAQVPFVLSDPKGKSWALRPAKVDISVFYPPRDAKPDWRSLDGRRQAQVIPGPLCNGKRPCLVEARSELESDDAVPVDRVVITDSGSAMLWLRPGCYRVTALLASDTTSNPVRHCITPESHP